MIWGAYENASTEKASTNVQRWKMQLASMENEVEMLAQASTDGATIDGSRCETDITKHPKHVNLRNNFKVGPTAKDWEWALTCITVA